MHRIDIEQPELLVGEQVCGNLIMSIAFYDRRVAATTFRSYRQTWSRPAAWLLTLLHCACDPKLRLATALALAIHGIPPNGIRRKEQRERLEEKKAA